MNTTNADVRPLRKLTCGIVGCGHAPHRSECVHCGCTGVRQGRVDVDSGAWSMPTIDAYHAAVQAARAERARRSTGSSAAPGTRSPWFSDLQ